MKVSSLTVKEWEHVCGLITRTVAIGFIMLFLLIAELRR